PDRTLPIDHPGPPGTVARVSLSDFLDADRAGRRNQLRGWVEGKVVLIGKDSSVEDRHATPFFTAFRSARWNTAGVEIQAATLHTLLSRQFLVPAPQWIRLAALAGTALAAVAIVVPLAPTAAFLWFG